MDRLERSVLKRSRFKKAAKDYWVVVTVAAIVLWIR